MPRKDFYGWDPFEELKWFRKQLRRFFAEEPFVFGFELEESLPETSVKKEKAVFRKPLIDVVDKGDSIEIVAELPGMSKEDIDINVTEDTVMITAKHKEEQKKEEKEKGFYYHERYYTAFKRVIPLPVPVIPEETKASFNNGILTITLKKKEPEKPKEEGFKVKIE